MTIAKLPINLRAGLLLALLLCPTPAQAAPFTFTLLPPSGDISGLPGSTIGWGYTLTNDSSLDWLVLSGLNEDPIVNATPDASLFDFPILAPGETRSVAYNPATSSGLFQITWDALAPEGFVNTGLFVLSGEFWDRDPLAGGSFLALADDQSAKYTATVASAPTPVPEPASLFLTVFGIGGGFFCRRRRR
jgi:PEP-CTERM motif-containing protein